MFGQMYHALSKLSPSTLRGPVGETPWKTVLSDSLNKGAAGLPGLFRQVLGEISAEINHAAFSQAPDSLFVPCPNNQNQTGGDRNKLIVNPSCINSRFLNRFYVFGQLMGVAIRSKCCLDLDMASSFWKLILRETLDDEDLSTYDHTAWASLQFKDTATGLEYDEKEFEEIFGDLTYTTVLGDGKTTVETRPGGKNQRVLYKDRHQYAKEAMVTRFHEAGLQMHFIKQGLLTIVPRPALALLAWQDLELRVCGEANLDLTQLKKHCTYRPNSYTEKSPIVQLFWQVLSEFSPVDQAKFLQFAWARTRLPPDMASDRMQLNILEGGPDILNTLPTAETCFFNVVIPHYKTIEQLRAKLILAINECTSITF